MNELLSQSLARTIQIGEQLETSTSGSDYLHSPQKEYLDQCGARLLSKLTAPIVGLARLAVWAEDRGPAMISLPRVGQEGTVFGQRKIRSMKKGCELVPATSHLKSVSDKRVSKVGRHIRALSMDELPQFTNVMCGEMSLVGPRPKEPTEFLNYCEIDPDFYFAYTLPKPGITGLEQINGRAHTTPVERIEFTKEYFAEACLGLDLDILRKTLTVVLTQNGAY